LNPSPSFGIKILVSVFARPFIVSRTTEFSIELNSSSLLEAYTVHNDHRSHSSQPRRQDVFFASSDHIIQLSLIRSSTFLIFEAVLKGIIYLSVSLFAPSCEPEKGVKHNSNSAFHVHNWGNKRRATCFTTVKHEKPRGSTRRGVAHENTDCVTLSCCRKAGQSGYRRAFFN
jgi:hypothetical protein